MDDISIRCLTPTGTRWTTWWTPRRRCRLTRRPSDRRASANQRAPLPPAAAAAANQNCANGFATGCVPLFFRLLATCFNEPTSMVLCATVLIGWRFSWFQSGTPTSETGGSPRTVRRRKSPPASASAAETLSPLGEFQNSRRSPLKSSRA